MPSERAAIIALMAEGEDGAVMRLGIPGGRVAPCLWSEDDQDACWYCSGAACAQGHDQPDCEHSTDERHLLRGALR